MKPPQDISHKMHRLILVDELPLYRRGIIELIRRQPDLEVCAEFSDRSSALAGITDATDTDLVVLELSRQDGAGVDLSWGAAGVDGAHQRPVHRGDAHLPAATGAETHAVGRVPPA